MGDIQLTLSGLMWVLNNACAVISDDFCGYMFKIDHKKKEYIVLISKDGHINISSAIGGKCSGKELIGVYKRLLKCKMLIFSEIPFAEESIFHNLPMKSDNIVYYKGSLFETVPNPSTYIEQNYKDKDKNE